MLGKRAEFFIATFAKKCSEKIHWKWYWSENIEFKNIADLNAVTNRCNWIKAVDAAAKKVAFDTKN